MNKLLALARNNLALSVTAVISILLFLLICNPAGLYFLCDDFAHVPLSIGGNLFHTYMLRPIPAASLWLDIRIWGMNAEGFHLTNLLLHLVNCVLIYFLARALQRRYLPEGEEGSAVPILTALLFLCYAFHSEPIFWIVGRGDSLACISIQVSLLCYLKQKTGFLLLGLVAFAVGLFTYELAWTVPILLSLLWLYEALYLKRKRPFFPVTLYINVLTAYLFFRYFTLKGTLSTYEAGNLMAQKYFSLLYNYAMLNARLFLPPMASGKIFFASFAGLLVLFAVLLFVLYRRSKQALAFVLLLAGLMGVSLLPVVSLGIDSHDTESERFIYPASVFACLLLVQLLRSFLKRPGVLLITLGVVLSFHLLFLYKASLSYRYASYLSRFTIESLNKVPGVTKLTFINLPSQYKGALLFRIGFPVWAPGILDTTYENAAIQSFGEVAQPIPFKRVISPVLSEPGHLHVSFEKDTLRLY